MMKRFFDIVLASFLCILFCWLIILVAIIIRFNSHGPSLYWSKRVGKDNILFNMPKFRSMIIDSPNVGTHLLKNPEKFITPVGSFIRRYSLDELPQLLSILKGDMSFVGPRPSLINEVELNKLRAEKGIDKLIPGLTGWAQINGRDSISIDTKVKLDLEYKHKKSFIFDLRILWATFFKVFRNEDVSH